MDMLDYAKGQVAVEFNEKFVEQLTGQQELYIEAGMCGRIIDCDYDSDGLMMVKVDLSEFEDYNIRFESTNWIKAGTLNETTNARDAGSYEAIQIMHWDPKDGDFTEFFRPIGAPRTGFHEEHQASGSDLPYVNWLEERLADVLVELESRQSASPRP